ncbi:MAG: PAS domain S-box protein [Nitrospiraceae bacterium]|nr:MAG: PAS domain S-box protein [Nitrospiraceae bacterium]
MRDSRHNILFVGNDESGGNAFQLFAEQKDIPYNHVLAASIDKVEEDLLSGKFDVVILDYSSDQAMNDVLHQAQDVPVIIVAGSSDAGTAVKAMKAGAYDFIVKDPEHDYLNILMVAIDNAVRHRAAEQRLRLLESAVMNANDAIIILEAEPGQMLGRRILYVNEAFTRMTGYSYEEATSRTLRILRGPRTSLAALNTIRLALEQVKPVRVEIINYRKDGSEFWVECNIVPFADRKGSFIHWVSVQRDITKRKQAEEERERLMKEIEAVNADLTELNRQLETIGAERTMSLMALTLADRVRNPATMIGARCRRLLDREDVPVSMQQGIKYIMEGAEKLDDIVKDFETLLKKRQSRFKNDDLNRIVERVVSIIEKDAVVKGVKLSLNLSVEPLRINMQKDLLRVALFHLMKNAVEATPGGGTISVETFRRGDNIGFSVSDTGSGIPPGEIENVFRPFFSTKERGFGMGLPLVKQIISEHLGDVNVSSMSGQGTTFQMLFPARWKEEKLYRN